jgi:hypothetical protein
MARDLDAAAAIRAEKGPCVGRESADGAGAQTAQGWAILGRTTVAGIVDARRHGRPHAGGLHHAKLAGLAVHGGLASTSGAASTTPASGPTSAAPASGPASAPTSGAASAPGSRSARGCRVPAGPIGRRAVGAVIRDRVLTSPIALRAGIRSRTSAMNEHESERHPPEAEEMCVADRGRDRAHTPRGPAMTVPPVAPCRETDRRPSPDGVLPGTSLRPVSSESGLA